MPNQQPDACAGIQLLRLVVVLRVHDKIYRDEIKHDKEQTKTTQLARDRPACRRRTWLTPPRFVATSR